MRTPADHYYIKPRPILVEVVARPRMLRSSKTGIYNIKGGGKNKATTKHYCSARVTI
jgi:hypothetical protein